MIVPVGRVITFVRSSNRAEMKIIFFLTAFTFIYTTGNLFAQDIAKSARVSSPIKIDGDPQEWTQPLRYYDVSTKLSFAVTNDDRNIYICFQTADELNQVKIMRAGMSVSLSPKGMHKVSINFPLQEDTANSQSRDNNRQPGFDRTNSRNNFLQHHTMMEVNGFTTRKGMIAINDSSGINTAINWDAANKLTYEIAIPLKELFGADFTAAELSKDITLHVEINAVKKKDGPGAGDENSGYAGKGSGGRGGGRMGGQGHHHNTASSAEQVEGVHDNLSRTSLFEKTELKQKFILAQN